MVSGYPVDVMAAIEETEDGIAYVAGQFPARCANCGATYETPAAYEAETTAPANGRSLATLGGVPMWLRNCRCGGTMALELQREDA